MKIDPSFITALAAPFRKFPRSLGSHATSPKSRKRLGVFLQALAAFVVLTGRAVTIEQDWSSAWWYYIIPGGNNPLTTIVQQPGGKPYLSVDLYRNNVNNGYAFTGNSLGTAAIPTGTTAGNVTPFWIDFDFRFKGGSTNANVFVGLFNSNGDNDDNPAMNWIGAQLSGSGVVGRRFNSAGGSSSADIAGGGTNVLQRVRMHVYNSGGQTLMDIWLYSLDEETFQTTKIGQVLGFVILAAGQTFPQGLNYFGVRNTPYAAGSPAAHAQMDFDNMYFSTDGASDGLLVPSFATLCVSTVLQTGSPYFDPWNATRWAAWYSGGKLAKSFTIDCDVTLEDRGGSANPWVPDVSGLTSEKLFYFGNCSRGITFDGNGCFIDARKVTPDLLTLYGSYGSYSETDRHPLTHCFYANMAEKNGVPATVLKNVWIKGCTQAIRTSSKQSHPLTIQNVETRRNQWGMYFSGTNTTITGCGNKQNAKGGIYLGNGSYGNSLLNSNWQDNDYQQEKYYADICIDSSYGNYFEGNDHQAATGGSYHAAVKLFRNTGEDGNLRENSAWGNVFVDNTVAGYSVGYEIGSRMGISVDYDMSSEGRDYAPYNLFEGNSFTNTTFGIKINASGNDIDGNTFSNVTYPILLHNVFFSLTETAILNQPGTKVSFWFKNSDYTGNSSYADWFKYQNDLNEGINVADRYTHLSYAGGTPSFDSYSGPAQLVKQPSSNPSQIINTSTMKDVRKSGGTPIDVAVGDFWVDNPGDEIAVIWDTPTSSVAGTLYYTIIIYDTNGIEVNRCGLSNANTKWRAITAGDFLDLPGQEIAAVADAPVGGKYPIYVFARGRKDPSVTLQGTNTSKIMALAGGNFTAGIDGYDEIAYVLQSDLSTIKFCKPTQGSWSATTATTGGISVVDLVGGDFDTANSGDEVAVMTATLPRARLYRVGASTHYANAGPSSGSLLTAIAAGNFDSDSADEVALALATATGGEYPIRCYDGGSLTHFKEISQNVQGVPARAIAACAVPVASTLGVYERAQGFTSSDYGQTMAPWGQNVAVLPSAAQTTAMPAFLLNADPTNSSKEYLKVTPIVR